MDHPPPPQFPCASKQDFMTLQLITNSKQCVPCALHPQGQCTGGGGGRGQLQGSAWVEMRTPRGKVHVLTQIQATNGELRGKKGGRPPVGNMVRLEQGLGIVYHWKGTLFHLSHLL